MALLEAKDVSVVYRPSRGVPVHAVRDVSLSLEQGEFVGLVGESGDRFTGDSLGRSRRAASTGGRRTGGEEPPPRISAHGRPPPSG